METNRPWLPSWTGLDVVIQKGITLRRRWRHPQGFEEPLAVHFPLDTWAQLARFRPEIIVSWEMGFRTLLACCYAKFHPASRILIWSEVTAITEQGRGTLRPYLRRFLARHVHGFLALGPAGVRYIQSLGVPAAGIFQLAYSTSLPAFLDIPLERHGPVATRLLFSGQLVARKGLHPFLQALSRWAMAHPERVIHFTLVGAGPERNALAALSLPANVKLVFIGSIQYHQLPRHYAEAGIFVLPTLADTWAVVVNEALAAGLPVLGSRNSQAVEEMVQDGESGWTFDPGDHAGMAQAINRALSSSEAELNRLRVNARRSALRITPETTAAVFDNAVQWLIRNR